MITLKQFTGANVTAADDAALYSWISNALAAVFSGCVITSLGANQCRITDGRGIIQGHTFAVQAEDFTVALADPGNSWPGRIYIEIDLNNASKPIAIKSIAAAALPALLQQDLNGSGKVYQMALATYTAGDTSITGLTAVVQTAKRMPTTDPAAMPIAGGKAFSGPVRQLYPNLVAADAGAYLRSVTVRSASGTAVKTGNLIMDRK